MYQTNQNLINQLRAHNIKSEGFNSFMANEMMYDFKRLASFRNSGLPYVGMKIAEWDESLIQYFGLSDDRIHSPYFKNFRYLFFELLYDNLGAKGMPYANCDVAICKALIESHFEPLNDYIDEDFESIIEHLFIMQNTAALLWPKKFSYFSIHEYYMYSEDLNSLELFEELSNGNWSFMDTESGPIGDLFYAMDEIMRELISHPEIKDLIPSIIQNDYIRSKFPSRFLSIIFIQQLFDRTGVYQIPVPMDFQKTGTI